MKFKKGDKVVYVGSDIKWLLNKRGVVDEIDLHPDSYPYRYGVMFDGELFAIREDEIVLDKEHRFKRLMELYEKTKGR